jgi:hypothetical protein
VTRDGPLRGDPRLDAADRAILRRLTSADLAAEFADALAQDATSDPLLSGESRDADE